jgi:hypothetical protein
MPRQVLSDLDFNNVARAINLPNPTAAQHAATKQYVDSLVEGLAWKDNVRVATQANITLTSPGATIDGVTMAANDRVLVRAQTTQSQNGLYIWNGAAVAMTRALDASTSDEMENAVVTVDEGTSAAATFRQSTLNFVLDTGNVVWTSFGTAAPAATDTTAGIVELATQAETDAGTDTARAITPATLGAYAGRIRRFPQTFGDGSATSFTITHNLNTEDVHVEVYRTSGNKDTILCDVNRTSVNAVQLVFAAAPAANAFRAVVFG